MIDLIDRNRLYFSLYFGFFAVGFAYFLQTEKLEAIYFFSDHRSAFANYFFRYVTLLGEAYPFIIGTIVFGFLKDRSMAAKMAVAGLLSLVLIYFLKEAFSHDRPYNVLKNANLLASVNFVDIYKPLRGDNSFPSGHTTGAFAFWTLLALYFEKKYAWQILFLVVAILVGISRVYLVAHFPDDVLFGSSVGILIALGVQKHVEDPFKTLF